MARNLKSAAGPRRKRGKVENGADHDDSSDTVADPQEVFEAAFKDVAAFKTALDLAGSNYRNAVKRAKGKGVDTRALTEAIRIKRQADQANERVFYSTLGRYLRWSGVEIGTQLGLFSEQTRKSPAKDRERAEVLGDESGVIRAAGRESALKGVTRGTNPHEAGSRSFQVWDNGWLDGEGERKRIEAMGDEPAAAETIDFKKGRRGRTRRAKTPPLEGQEAAGTA